MHVGRCEKVVMKVRIAAWGILIAKKVRESSLESFKNGSWPPKRAGSKLCRIWEACQVR